MNDAQKNWILEAERVGALSDAQRKWLQSARAAGAFDQPAKDGGFFNAAMRTAEFGARGVMDRASDVIGGIPDLVAKGTNAIGLTDLPPDYYSNALKDAYRSFGKAITPQPQQFGPNEPQNAIEKGAYGAGKGVVDAASFVLPAAAASKAGGLVGQVGKAASSQPGVQLAAGATGGAVSEATDSPGLGMLAAMAVPAAPAVKNMAKGVLANQSAKSDFIKSAPTRASIKAASQRAYDSARSSGVVVRPESFSSLADDLARTAEKEGAADGLTPQLMSAINHIGKRGGQDVGIEDLEIIRRQLGLAMGDMNNKGQTRIAGMLQDKLDDFVANLADGDLIAGTGAAAKAAASSLREARALWSQNRKMEIIEDAIRAAEGNTASGPENGLRIEFRKILNNKKKLRGFTNDEQAAIRNVVEGTPTRNAMRLLGKFGFDFKSNTNALGALLGLGGGTVMGGPVGAIVVPAVGSAARYASRKSTMNAAELAKAITAARGIGPKRIAPPLNLDALGAVAAQRGLLGE